MAEVWAPGCRNSGSKDDMSLGCSGRLRRTFSLGFAGSLLRWRRQPPLSPSVLRRHPYAALLDVAVQGAPAQVSAPKRKMISSAPATGILPWLRQHQPCLFFQDIVVYISLIAITECDLQLDAADVAPLAVGKGRGLMERTQILTESVCFFSLLDFI